VATDLPTRRSAIRTIEQGHAEIRDLIGRLRSRDLTRQEIGRGRWSAKDVIGHMGTWERFALEALEAWDRDRPWARESDLWNSVSRTNVTELERQRRWSTPEVRRRADATHAELLERLREMTDARWRAPATSRGRSPLGSRLGGILGGPGGPFRHAEEHLRDLRIFVERATAPPAPD
jgi:hypothetical protein